MDGKVFNSFDNPVPPVRRDLQVIPLQHNGEQVLFFHDILGYTPRNFALDPKAEPVLSLLNGRFSIRQINRTLDGKIGAGDLLEFVQMLDRNCILETDYYLERAGEKEEAFESSPVRPAALAGESYPAETKELRSYLDDILADRSNHDGTENIKALYAPHIDPNVGAKVYGSAFARLGQLKPERVVILATAHYTGYYRDLYINTPFIGSEKSFELPGSTFLTDRNYMDALLDTSGKTGFTVRDRAHRVEHSIELHLLFASHVWSHDFRIVPILVNSFDDLLYMEDGDLGQKVTNFSRLLRELDDDRTFYLISGDLSHVGKKFGDSESASVLRDDVSDFDEKFMEFSAGNEHKALLRHIRSIYDRYRVCGFPPLYTFMNAFPDLAGNRIDYYWWNEKERESAVSIGAIEYS